MPSVLLTAFESYDRWPTNASGLVLDELARTLPPSPQVITRVLPVDFDAVKLRLSEELSADYDYVLHLGQSPGSTRVQLEAVALNVACDPERRSDRPLCDDGPLAYRSTLPLYQWAEQIRSAGIPAEVSFHAGTYLCNAALYLTHYYRDRMKLKTQAAFFHLPLDPVQVVGEKQSTACLPAALSATAVRIVLENLRRG